MWFSWFSSYRMYSLSVTDHQSRKAPLLFAAIPTLPKCSLRDFHFALVPLRTPIEFWVKLQGACPRCLSRDSCTSQAGSTSLLCPSSHQALDGASPTTATHALPALVPVLKSAVPQGLGRRFPVHLHLPLHYRQPTWARQRCRANPGAGRPRMGSFCC